MGIVVGAWTPLITAAQPAASAVPPVRHVFVIVLENQGYAATFGNPTADPYLATTLPAHGALLTNYYGIGHESNPNYLAMVSGQAPNPQTQADCQYYSDFVGTGVVPPGQAVGTGCVFPSSVPTIGNQLSTAGFTWKGYMQDMGNIPSRESSTCGHPALNAQDKTQSAVVGDGYATRHDPFVYFHSVVDNAAYCAAHVVPLGAPGAAPSGLAHDLQSSRTTPNLSFIVPNLCLDGHDYPCTNQTAPATSALGDMDAFLQTWVPLITHSAAFRANGLLVVTFDEATGPPSGDSSACCGELPGPNSPLPGIDGPGGGRTGAVVLSPFVQAGTVTTTGYNHYSLLGSIEGLFGLGRLGEAQTVPATFGSDVFTSLTTR
jgi:phospholipase C